MSEGGAGGVSEGGAPSEGGVGGVSEGGAPGEAGASSAGAGGAGDGCVTGRVRVDYVRQSTNAQIEYELDVVNLGSASIPANQLEIRYYLARENAGVALTGSTVVNQLHEPFVGAGGGVVTSAVTAADAASEGADHYVRITFGATTGIVQNQLVRIRTYFQPANQTQANDYSYGTHSAKTAWDRIVVFVDGVQEWGCLP